MPKDHDGEEQGRQEIQDGAHRAAAGIAADLDSSTRHLEEDLNRSSSARWPNGHLLGGGHYGVAGCPAHRLREVEVHHVDLGLGQTPAGWPARSSAFRQQRPLGCDSSRAVVAA